MPRRGGKSPAERKNNMLKYIVSVEYRLNGERKTVKTYKEAATIKDAKRCIDLMTRLFKADCDIFGARIYTITDY